MPKPGREGEHAKPDYRRPEPCAMIVTMAYDEDLANRNEPWAMESFAFARALPPKKK